ncbi:MAG: ABC transporter substrate-binding protein [Flavobacteriales bacterium]|nr:ABC transporter substrate-binding protein [Flavobacteriales bacterium]
MKPGPFWCAAALLCACDGPVSKPDEGGEWSAIPNAYAKHFEFQTRGRERRVLVFGPNGRSDTSAVITSRSGLEMDPMTVPLDRVAVVSTTHLPFFEALGSSGTVIGVAHTRALRPGVFRDQVAKGNTVEISRADGLDKERLIALGPQALFNYPFGRSIATEAASIPMIPVTEYLEQHPLGRAEWIRFFGHFLGKEDRADSIFRAIEHRYGTIKDLDDGLEEGPFVCFGSNWEKNWFAPPGNSYMATLITDAGGRYWFADSTSSGNIAVPLERLLVMGRSARHFGAVLEADGEVDMLRLAGGDPRIAELDAVRQGGFIANSAVSDIFGTALLEPDVILRDLRCIFRPGTCGTYRPSYFFPLAQ